MSNDNAKVSDSGYTNTCEHSQSQQKSGSSPSNKNSNRSGSSGYCGDHPFNSGISNEALTQPISETKDKEHQKKKSKTTTPLGSGTKSALKSVGQQTKTGPSTVVSNILDQKFEKSEVGNVELVDAKEPGEHNGDSNFIIPKREIVSQINSPDSISPKLNDGFYTVVSLNDGLILYSSSSLQTALGYPKNSWLGCSFIDFIHPNNRKLFMDKLSDGIFLLLNNRQENINEQRTNFFCNLQCNPHNIQKNDDSDANQKSLHQIQIVTDNENTSIKTSAYLPFHMSLCFKNFLESMENAHSSTMALIIRSEPILSAYEAAENKITSFTTRHNANCRFTHLDNEVVQYFGYLPQDMMERSVFDYYHPEDMPSIKEIYKTIIRLSGAAFKSKPYRFYIHNGEYILLETEWSAFVNPWEKKIEFVIGQHRVLRGPVDVNIFHQTQQQLSMTNIMNDNLSEEVLIKSRIIEGEICALLAERIQSCTFDGGSAIKFKDIASFVENKTCDNDKNSLPTSRTSVMDTDEKRFSKREGVMAGEISSPQKCSGTKSSSETPLTYHQLNYNDKIERFFNSKPIVNIGSVIEEKIFHSNSQTSNSSPRKNGSGGSGSGEYFSNGSNNLCSGKDRFNNNSNSTSTDNFQAIPLTEILLKKHNQDMEQLMVQKHKKRQSNIKTGNSHKNNIKNDDNIIIIINNNNNNNNNVTEEAKLEKTKDKKIQDKSRNGKRNGCLILEDEHVKVPRYNGTNKNTEKLLVKKHRERLSSGKTSRMDINTQRLHIESEESELTNSWSRRDRKRKSGHVCKEELFKIPMKNKRYRSSTKNNNATLCVKTKIDKFVLNEVRTNNNTWSQLPSTYQNTLHPSGLNQIPIYYAPVAHIQIDNKNMESQSALPQYSSVSFGQYQYQYQYQQSPYVSYPTSYGGIMYPTIISGAGSAPTQFTYPSMMAQGPSQLNNLQKPVTSLSGKHSTELKWPIGQDTSVKAELGSIMATTESSKKLYSPSYHYSSCVSIYDRNGQNESSIEDSSDSSFYGSYLTTSTNSSSNCSENDYTARISKINALNNGGGESTNRRFGMISSLKNETAQHNMEATTSSLQKKGLPWYHSVQMTPEIIYNYQMSPKDLSEVLKDDLEKLKTYKQPHLVSDQIDQLYLDQELESFSTKLILDSGNSSRDYDSFNQSTNCTSYVLSQVKHECTILYEKK
ncbi:period circadian protein isoform X2 [Microplitis mediator]|uniref:period circadian protein isoform X2 n=1 Tax=Microplitis mediator TaxID=375433 RepID=UPI0025549BF4|nr:period circadian protein isoform X2 [Microplitis mediator]